MKLFKDMLVTAALEEEADEIEFRVAFADIETGRIKCEVYAEIFKPSWTAQVVEVRRLMPAEVVDVTEDAFISAAELEINELLVMPKYVSLPGAQIFATV